MPDANAIFEGSGDANALFEKHGVDANALFEKHGPAPAQHGLGATILHYAAKALPALGGVGGAVAAGVPAIPTGPGALLAAGAAGGLGIGAGAAARKAIDQYLGYEKPDLKRDLIEVGTEGLAGATMGVGAGVGNAV